MYTCVYVMFYHRVATGKKLADSSVLHRISKKMVKLFNNCNDMCNFIALGDMNSRVGSLNDFDENDDINLYAFDFFARRLRQEKPKPIL